MAGIEDVDELWSRLRVATDQAKSLAATNRELVARIASLERQLGQSGALSDDELLAQLPRRMGRALESAQEVAAELIGRAQQREESIRQQTDQRCTALITHAEAEATAILRRAAGEAVARVNAAKSEAQAILRVAQSRHDQVMSELHQQSLALDDRVNQLRRQHSRLEQAYEVAGRSLDDARGALRASVEAAGPSPQGRSGATVPLRVVHGAPEHGSSPARSGSA